ncbi:GNAT family N-acetyltransferase [Chengkuizengella axinellae]|uniref:GNAT family N-acetyltransferase n=1 Tax=Chengkuizengella axinellae TaxID=3064388 RepID=A0ABT9J324_9BACL|nr:GNAT family N-acetyltransferase [Chengkuizengella sp. 2205SS18-9]MDP5276026.1 GNAT family N-acetyltransferase [Chengkuizengella sp. 2205SS18-9]
MKELLEKDYNKILKLLDRGIQYPEVISIIEKNNPGTIFVDEIYEPKSALVWNQGMKGFYFLGDPESKLFLEHINEFMDHFIPKFLKERNISCFEGSGTTQEWDETIKKVFENKDLHSGKQRIYTWDYNSNIHQMKHFKYKIYSIRSMNHQSFFNWKYYERVLVSFWGSIDQLIEKGNCYYAVDGNKIIGICYSGFVTSNTKTIGIETDEKYRKQGVGYHLALHCIRDILQEGKMIWWDCMEENIGSGRLAEKLGFVKSQEYECYYSGL